MQDFFDFSGKTVFIMGGTSGINLGIAECFAKAGASLIVASRSQDKVDAAVKHLQSMTSTAAGFAADARDAQAIEQGLQPIAEELGPIDVMVIGQAGNFPAAAMDLSANAFKSVVDIDLLGTFNATRVAHQFLNSESANIINISAPQAAVPMEYQAHVCAAKAGVDMLTKVLAMELGKDNVRVNAIVPGPIADTEGMARLTPTPEMEETARKLTPLQRYGSTHEIGNCAMFLASSLAEYITGAIIPVDGGWSLAAASAMSSTLAEMSRKTK